MRAKSTPEEQLIRRSIQATCKAILKLQTFSFVSRGPVVDGDGKVFWPKKGRTYRKPIDDSVPSA